MLEHCLIEHCAPTLAGIKSANMLNYHFERKERVLWELASVNHKLNIRGVFVEAILWKENSVLIYTYRPSHLQRELYQEGVKELLAEYGYKDVELRNCLNRLKERLYQYDCFPHEVGIFLGYPLEDVKGFIKNKGRDCKCCGIWKVYCNEQEKEKLFEKLYKCTRVYMQVFEKGRSIVDMTVIA